MKLKRLQKAEVIIIRLIVDIDNSSDLNPKI